MLVYKIEVIQLSHTNKEYVTKQDAAVYLHMSRPATDNFIKAGMMLLERIEMRWLLEWESVKNFDRTYTGQRWYKPDWYGVEIIRPAVPAE